MKITIHRGTAEIGGTVTEYEIGGWRLFVDFGTQLPGAPKSSPLKIEGLTHGDISKSGLLITHYHGDHIGKIADLPADLPIFMGCVARDIVLEVQKHLVEVSPTARRLADRLEGVRIFEPGRSMEFGPFRVTPISVDHSAFDAYAFVIDGRGTTVYHTGDFRAHGFRSGKFLKMIETRVGRVDYVVCEATNATNVDAVFQTERDLQRQFEESFRCNKANIVYVSSTNIDRLFSLYHAALRAGRPFYVSAYQKRIMDIVACGEHLWDKACLYKYGKYEPEQLLFDDGEYRVNDKFRDYLADKGYVLVAQANTRFNNLIDKMPGDKVVYLSMWEEYVNPDSEAYNPVLHEAVGCDYRLWHTTGHCSMTALKSLLEILNPKAVIPMHTDSPRAFADYFCNAWPVLLLGDGETFAPIKDTGYDNITAAVIARGRQLDRDGNVFELDEKCIGEFASADDALFALKRVCYAPGRLLGYAVREDEDMSPFDYKTYTPDFALFNEYTFGRHAPGREAHGRLEELQPGETVWCVTYAGFNVIFSATVEGALTGRYLRDRYERDIDLQMEYDSADEAVADWPDWDWDSVIVKPIGNPKATSDDGRVIVNRVNIFTCNKQ